MGNATCSVSLVPPPPLLLLLRRRRIRRRDDASDGGRCSAPGRGHNIDRCKGRHDEVQVPRGVSCRECRRRGRIGRRLREREWRSAAAQRQSMKYCPSIRWRETRVEKVGSRFRKSRISLSLLSIWLVGLREVLFRRLFGVCSAKRAYMCVHMCVCVCVSVSVHACMLRSGCLDSVDRSCLIKLNSACKGRKGRNVSLKEAPIKGFPCNTVDAACSGWEWSCSTVC